MISTLRQLVLAVVDATWDTRHGQHAESVPVFVVLPDGSWTQVEKVEVQSSGGEGEAYQVVVRLLNSLD